MRSSFWAQSTRRVAWFVYVAAIILRPTTTRAVEVQFDYTYDTLGFFDDPLRREVLEFAASHVNRFVDTLEAVEPTEENSWSIFPALPPGGANTFLVDEVIPHDTLVVFVGGNNVLPGRTLAQSSFPGPINLAGDDQWEATINFRGQTGASTSPAADYGPWGGVVMFNSDETDVPWHFGLTTDGMRPVETDFLTVAMHELIHVFGFGPAESFQALSPDLEFHGPESLAVGSRNNTELELNDGGHWRRSTVSEIGDESQAALLNPIIGPGGRRFPTVLERAALRDVGWVEALAGDASLDREFDMNDIMLVLQSAKYLTGETASWRDGDWNDDLRFDQTDVIAALSTGTYLSGPYAAIMNDGERSAADRSTDFAVNDMHLGNGALANFDLTHAAVVPEPTSIVLLSMGMLFALLRRILTYRFELSVFRHSSRISPQLPQFGSRT